MKAYCKSCGGNVYFGLSKIECDDCGGSEYTYDPVFQKLTPKDSIDGAAKSQAIGNIITSLKNAGLIGSIVSGSICSSGSVSTFHLASGMTAQTYQSSSRCINCGSFNNYVLCSGGLICSNCGLTR